MGEGWGEGGSLKFFSCLSAGLLLFATACSLRFQVWNEESLKKIQIVAVVPIAVGTVQKELSSSYFPQFQIEFTKMFEKKFKIVAAETVQSRIETAAGALGKETDFTWEFMLGIGKEVGADALVGLLIDESDSPGKLIEYIKIVSVKNGKALASNNFLFKSSAQYSFKDELGKLRTVFSERK